MKTKFRVVIALLVLTIGLIVAKVQAGGDLLPPVDQWTQGAGTWTLKPDYASVNSPDTWVDLHYDVNLEKFVGTLDFEALVQGGQVTYVINPSEQTPAVLIGYGNPNQPASVSGQISISEPDTTLRIVFDGQGDLSIAEAVLSEPVVVQHFIYLPMVSKP